MKYPRAYIAHAITAPLALGEDVWRQHYDDVQRFATEVALCGFAPIVPQVLPGLGHRQCMTLDHSLVDVADVVAVHDSIWVADSTGVQRERRWAREAGIPTVFGDDFVRLRALATDLRRGAA